MRGSKKHRSLMFHAMPGRSLPQEGRAPKGRTPLRGKCGSHPVERRPRSHLWNFFPPGPHAAPAQWEAACPSATPPYEVRSTSIHPPMPSLRPVSGNTGPRDRLIPVRQQGTKRLLASLGV